MHRMRLTAWEEERLLIFLPCVPALVDQVALEVLMDDGTRGCSPDRRASVRASRPRHLAVHPVREVPLSRRYFLR